MIKGCRMRREDSTAQAKRCDVQTNKQPEPKPSNGLKLMAPKINSGFLLIKY
jgi:hypothetical protein